MKEKKNKRGREKTIPIRHQIKKATNRIKRYQSYKNWL